VSFVAPSLTRRRPDAAVPQDKLAELVRRTFGTELVASAMPSGASPRRYFRVALPEGKSAVAMWVPEGAHPDEVHRAPAGPRTRWPFLEVRDLLDEHGIDVPAVFAEDTDEGWIVIEDLGDDTLAKWLSSHEERREPLYQKAVRDLARAQNELATPPRDSLLAHRTFDADLLAWEMEHFREWALDGRGKPLSPADAPRWRTLTERLAARVADLPRGFVHRDYQSRNLMVQKGREGERLVWIDFQDAVTGPRVYDLVSLLSDSYQTFDRAFIEARLADYADAAALPGGDEKESRTRLLGEFDMVMVQRKLKDAGRFVFIDRLRGNDAFLRFVPPTLVKIDTALARLAPHEPDMAELRDILRRTLGDELP
jgi:aminoglycoside/choline kinase family phosphotransferase